MDPETFFRRAKAAWRVLTQPAPEGTTNREGLLVLQAGKSGVQDEKEPDSPEGVRVLEGPPHSLQAGTITAEKITVSPPYWDHVHAASASISAGEYVLRPNELIRLRDDQLLAAWKALDAYEEMKQAHKRLQMDQEMLRHTEKVINFLQMPREKFNPPH